MGGSAVGLSTSSIGDDAANDRVSPQCRPATSPARWRSGQRRTSPEQRFRWLENRVMAVMASLHPAGPDRAPSPWPWQTHLVLAFEVHARKSIANCTSRLPAPHPVGRRSSDTEHPRDPPSHEKTSAAHDRRESNNGTRCCGCRECLRDNGARFAPTSQPSPRISRATGAEAIPQPSSRTPHTTILPQSFMRPISAPTARCDSESGRWSPATGPVQSVSTN